MFDAFKVGVTVHLRNMAHSGLMGLQNDFRRGAVEAGRLTRQMDTLRLLMGAGLITGTKGQAQLAALGAQLAIAKTNASALTAQLTALKGVMVVTGGAALGGYLGFKAIGGIVGGGTGYQEALNQMTMVGIKGVEAADAIAAAWKNTALVMSATPAEALKDIIDARAVIGSVSMATELLPVISMLSGVASATAWGSGGRGMSQQTIATDMSKALDMLGKTETKEEFIVASNMMAQAVIWSKGMVNFETYRMLGKYSRSAKYGFSNEFLFRYLPKLAVDYASRRGGGGAHGGVGAPLAALFRFGVQGTMPTASAELLEKIGLVPRGRQKFESATGASIVRGGMIGKHLLIENPFEWTHKYVVPAIMRAHPGLAQPGEGEMAPAKRREWTDMVGHYFKGNQVASGLLLDMIIQKKQFMRDYRNTGLAMPIEDAYLQARHGSPALIKRIVSSQWEAMKTALSLDIWPKLIMGAYSFAEGLSSLARLFQRMPALANAVFYGMTALTLAMSGLAIAGVIAIGVKALSGALVGTMLATGVTAIAAAFGLPVWGTLLVIATGITAVAAAFGLLAVPADPSQGPASRSPFALYRSQGLFAPGGPLNWPGSVPPPITGNVQPVVVNVELDGQTVGRITTEAVAEELDGPSAGTSTFDSRQSMADPGAYGGQ